ncbi:MAG TPA: ABC transporter permease [Alphaproteobacteria bacterium]|nr:ABC transporter permease [Alphaproteobacteria bacterium]
MSSSADHLPRLRVTIRRSWSALFDVAAGFMISGVILALLGVDPFATFASLLRGAFGYPEAIGYTLYYTTTYIFVGLAVWIGLQAGLFNIGGEGQVYLGGLGAGLICGAFPSLPGFLSLPLACLAAASFGAAWMFVPALLLAKRGSSIVVTTIMFNFIASALMTWLLTSVMIQPGQAAPETPIFPKAHWMPSFAAILGSVGIQVAKSPANLSLVLALLAIPLTRSVVDRMVFGYELRVLGGNPEAAAYAGISSGRVTLMALCLSGALAGLAGVNEVAGVHHRIILDFPNGAGFVAIAVALMAGRNAWGVLPAAILFAALSQGSVDLMIDNPRMNRDLVVLVQGLVTLFAGAMRGQIRLPRKASTSS